MPTFSITRELEALQDPDRPRIVGRYKSAACCMIGVVKIKAGSTEGFWERHDGGDELLMLIQGRMRFTIRSCDGQEEVLQVGSGDMVLIPRGSAHTACIAEDIHAIFVTPDEDNAAWSDDEAVKPRH